MREGLHGYLQTTQICQNWVYGHRSRPLICSFLKPVQWPWPQSLSFVNLCDKELSKISIWIQIKDTCVQKGVYFCLKVIHKTYMPAYVRIWEKGFIKKPINLATAGCCRISAKAVFFSYLSLKVFYFLDEPNKRE